MSHRFHAGEGLVIVRTEVSGPSGTAILRFALDTGATTTLINVGMLVAVGCDPGASPDRVEVTTGSGVEFAPRVKLDRIAALGRELRGFSVLAHTLPPSAEVDGLLGLDFFRGTSLNLDFHKGSIVVE